MMMQIVIDIPKDFEEHFNQDRFEETLHRLSIDAHLVAGNYEQETATMLINALKKCTILPKGHGRLIDADALYDEYEYADYDFEKTMEYAPTIIEADKGDINADSD